MRPTWNRLVHPLKQIGNHDGFVGGFVDKLREGRRASDTRGAPGFLAEADGLSMNCEVTRITGS